MLLGLVCRFSGPGVERVVSAVRTPGDFLPSGDVDFFVAIVAPEITGFLRPLAGIGGHSASCLATRSGESALNCLNGTGPANHPAAGLGSC